MQDTELIKYFAYFGIQAIHLLCKKWGKKFNLKKNYYAINVDIIFCLSFASDVFLYFSGIYFFSNSFQGYCILQDN